MRCTTIRFVLLTIIISTTTKEALAQPVTAAAAPYKIQEIRLGRSELQYSYPLFSRDGHHFAYIAFANIAHAGQFVVVVDGQAGAKYDEIALGSLFISPDGKHVGYVAGNGKESVVVKGWPRYPGVLDFDEIEGRFRVVEGKGFMVVDGKEGTTEYDRFGRDALFSPDSKHVAYGAQKGMNQLAVIDGNVGAEYDGIGENTLTFSPDSKHVAYVVKNGNKFAVVVDGKAEAGFDNIKSLTFTPDSKHVAYQAEKGEKELVVVDGKPGPEYEHIDIRTVSFLLGGTLSSFSSDGVADYLAERQGLLYHVKYILMQ